MEPRPIEPSEIRVGDRVRAVANTGLPSPIVTTYEFVVDAVFPMTIYAKSAPDTAWGFGCRDNDWTLIDRPTPKPAVGSRWRHSHPDRPEFVYGDDGRYYCYKGGGAFEVGEWFVDRSDGIRDYLTPIPEHGDGCSPWLWDPETDTGWVESEIARHESGMRITHVQMRGEQTNGLTLTASFESDREIAARLRPWSERHA